MFDAVSREVARRILEGRALLSMVPSDDHATKISAERRRAVATCKGLLFVQLYGAYEHAVHRSVQAALDFFRSESMSCRQTRRSLLSLVLNPQWDSAREVG